MCVVHCTSLYTCTVHNTHIVFISWIITYQKGAYYYGIKVFNSLPSQIKDLSANKNQFRCALESFLYSHSFYTLDDYFSYNKS